MADCVSSAPTPANHLSYTVTNERGWNDPPTSVFSPSGNTNRKRIDPRKARVHHNINAAGFYNQPLGNNSAFQSNSSSMQHNFQNLSLAPGQSSIHHANSNPDLSNAIPNHFVPPQAIQHAASEPYKLHNMAEPNLHGQMNGMATPPNSIASIPPIFGQTNGSYTPPTIAPARKFSAPSVSAGGINDIFQNHATPTMLQTSHLNKSFETAQNMVPNGQTAPAIVEQSIPPVSNQLSVNQTRLENRSPIPPYSQKFCPVTTQPHSLPPMPSNDISSNLSYMRSSSTPGPLARVSPTNAFVAPPPIAGFYTSNRNSPKNISPLQSGKNSPIPNEQIENDSQLLEETIGRLNSCKTKCMCHVTNKVNDEISKRITLFSNCWTQGKLSTPVKLRMSELSIELEKCEFTQADTIHRSLITSYSKEVMPWMVGIKKLISSYQRAIEENNKYQ